MPSEVAEDLAKIRDPTSWNRIPSDKEVIQVLEHWRKLIGQSNVAEHVISYPTCLL